MRIILAHAMGLCFGVRAALNQTEKITQPTDVAILGELVHNPVVIDKLRRRGFREGSHEISTPTVLVTAHGISDRAHHRLISLGKSIIDTTCPLVRRVHDAAQRLQRTGHFIVVIGNPAHVEVRGIVEDLGTPFQTISPQPPEICAQYAIVQTPHDVQNYLHPQIGVVMQTTIAQCEAAHIIERIRQVNVNAQIHVEDTICQPTKDRQHAMDELVGLVQAVVVIGGMNSNNTRKLVARATERGITAFHVQGPGELRGEWFDHIHTVGLTAGTSTLPETIQAVHAELLRIAAGRLRPTG